MTPALWSLLGFVLWMFVLLVAIGVGHFVDVGRGRSEPRDLRGDGAHGSPRHQRLHRAHENCVENIGPFAVVVLVATVVGVRVDGLAIATLCARVVQSSAHVASGENRAVVVRLAFFLVQWGLMLGMVAVIARAARS
jgi:uncharacterized MAPEG superfamily protein